MTTVVNTPAPASNDNSGMGMIIGVIVLLAVVFLIFFYGMPYMRGTQQQEQSAPTIQVPDKVDINITKPQ